MKTLRERPIARKAIMKLILGEHLDQDEADALLSYITDLQEEVKG